MLILLERVNEAQRLAVRELREMQANDPRNKKRNRGGAPGGNGEGDDDGDRDTQDYFENGPSTDYNEGGKGGGGGGGGKKHKKSRR